MKAQHAVAVSVAAAAGLVVAVVGTTVLSASSSPAATLHPVLRRPLRRLLPSEGRR